MVDTDGVRIQGFHEGGIALALLGVEERIGLGQLICDSWSDISTVGSTVAGRGEGRMADCTFDEILGPIAVEELGPDNRNRIDGINSTDGETGKETSHCQRLGKHASHRE